MKLVIVKSDKPIPVLYVATAVSYDITTNVITLNRMVAMAEGETNEVTKDRCYEYDVDTYEAINGLFTTGQERIAAALQMSDNELQPAEINPAAGHEFVEEQRH
jgi:hypothetical protein